MDNEIRFLYSVFPKKPIKNLLPNGRPINSPKSLQLTKEQVLYCMKFGTVYRRFGEGREERTTTLNLDRLHNREYIEEKDWNASKSVEEPVKTPDPESTVEPTKEPEKVEEVKESEPVVTETVEETTEEVTETVNEEVFEDSVEVKDEVEIEETEDEEEEETDERGTVVNTEAEIPDQITPASGNYNNYNHKKKKRH